MRALLSTFDLIYAAASPTPSPSPVDASGGSWPSAALIGLVGVIIGAVLTWLSSMSNRKQARQQFATEQAGQRTRLLTERFGMAAEQIGHERPAVRLAGVHAMAALADEWEDRPGNPGQRQECVDVLCAYLRLPPWEQPGEGEVRETIVRQIRHHLLAGASPSWSELDFNFRRATFAPRATFNDSTFSGKTSFEWARFSDDALVLGPAKETGPPGTTRPDAVWFERTMFSRDTSFRMATFAGDAKLSGATFGGANRPVDVNFTGATFAGKADFGGATFAGQSTFDGATFAGKASFDGTTFTGDTSFGVDKFITTFTDDASFSKATFCGSARFASVQSRSAIDLRQAQIGQGAAPIFTLRDGSATSKLPLIPAKWDGEEET